MFFQNNHAQQLFPDKPSELINIVFAIAAGVFGALFGQLIDMKV